MSRNTKKRLLMLLVGVNLAVIWGASLMTGEDSGSFSGAVLAFLGKFLPVFQGEAGHTLLRKLAHFSEFACLGLLTAALRRQNREKLLPCLGFGLAVACIDETIQVFVPDRGPSLIDVWIDAAGFTTGLLILILGYTLARKSHRNSHS